MPMDNLINMSEDKYTDDAHLMYPEIGANDIDLSDCSENGPIPTPRDLRVLERFGGKARTALEARAIVLKRKQELAIKRDIPSFSEKSPNEMYSEVATGVIVNGHTELLELIDEIEMLESMIIELESRHNGFEPDPKNPLSATIDRAFKKKGCSETMLNRLRQRLVDMKAVAVAKAVQLNLMPPSTPRAPESPGNLSNYSAGRRLQSGKDFIRQTYPDIIHKPKTKLFNNSPSQIGTFGEGGSRAGSRQGSPASLHSKSPQSNLSSGRTPSALDLEVERRLRTSARYVETNGLKDMKATPQLPPVTRSRRRRLTGGSLPPLPREPSRYATPIPPPSLNERRRNCQSFFDLNAINTKEAHSWLTRDRHRGEVNWITGLRQYEPLNV
eukprot:Blabericola_migrator_1__2024@NODE_1551_length_4301_cov_90_086207_g1016_i0_p1_GENE_NODE_1551_length_4301_cov_90_086207_g1016_i0NODE_1551_length_4301_cov_90_086207_g1016_i0_p1_ORF_typecomplete_len385_score58_02LzipperMIP1/PF14389_6/1_3KAR9/PF08580_10/0_77_NODE_1551_length_4301_cov_90_086207_g1016_i010552209